MCVDDFRSVVKVSILIMYIVQVCSERLVFMESYSFKLRRLVISLIRTVLTVEILSVYHFIKLPDFYRYDFR